VTNDGTPPAPPVLSQLSPRFGGGRSENLPRPGWPEALQRQFSDGLLLALAGLGLLAGAEYSSLHHLRVFSSPFPLWILIALNGAIALVAGVAAACMPDPAPPRPEDPNVLRIPRKEWDSLQRRLRLAGLESAWPDNTGLLRLQRDLDRGGSPEPASSTMEHPPGANLPGAPRQVGAGRLSPAAAGGRERALLELQCIAEGALFASENLSVEEVEGLIDDSSADLIRIAKSLDVGWIDGERSSELLIRLLRLHITMRTPPSGGRFAVASIGQLATRLQCRGRKSTPPPVLATPADQVRTPSDEFDAISRELAPVDDSASRGPTRSQRATGRESASANPPV
jgi:hypothetical protein